MSSLTQIFRVISSFEQRLKLRLSLNPEKANSYLTSSVVWFNLFYEPTFGTSVFLKGKLLNPIAIVRSSARSHWCKISVL